MGTAGTAGMGGSVTCGMVGTVGIGGTVKAGTFGTAGIGGSVGMVGTAGRPGTAAAAGGIVFSIEVTHGFPSILKWLQSPHYTY